MRALDDADRLNDTAERLLVQGDAGALVLLVHALDAAPRHVGALENLGAAALAWPEQAWVLFDRFERAVAAATSDEEARALRWCQLGWAAAFGRTDVLERVALGARPGGEVEREAAVGALLVELGHLDAGERRLREVAEAPLGAYHLARLAARRGGRDAARVAFAALGPKDDDDVEAALLGEIGHLDLALDGDADEVGGARKAARALFARRERGGEPLPWYLASELIVLHVRVATLEGRTEDAAFTAARLLPPRPRDPSAMLRAAAHVGPLHRL